MQEKPLHTSKYSSDVSIGVINIVALIGFSLFFYDKVFSSDKPILAYAILTTLTSVLALIFLYGMLTLNKIYVYENYFILKNILGIKTKKIFLPEVTHWAEKFIETNNEGYRTLRLFLKHKKIDINEKNYKNYTQIKESLTFNKPNTSKERQKKYDRNRFRLTVIYGVGASLLFWAIFIIGITVLNNVDEIDESETVLIKDILIQKPKIKNEDDDVDDQSIILSLKAYPDYKFVIQGDAFEVTGVYSLIKNATIGDTITIRVLTKEFPVNDSENEESYWQEPAYRYINVYYLSTLKLGKEKVYLYIDEYNEVSIQYRENSKYFIFIPILISIISIVIVYKKGKKLKAKYY